MSKSQASSSAPQAIPDELTQQILNQISALGPGDDLPSGKRRLDEKTYPEIKQFKVEVRLNESQHRGRPHCAVTTDKGQVSVDLETGEIIAGDAKRWNTPIRKTITQHKKALLKFWDDTRPDDQKLPAKGKEPEKKKGG